MENKIHNEFDTHLDAKKRITLRKASYKYYHVTEYDDGSYKLEPRQLIEPIPNEIMYQLQDSIEAIKKGRKPKPLNLDDIPDA